MRLAALLGFTLPVLFTAADPAASSRGNTQLLRDSICLKIVQATSSRTSVYYPGDLRYRADVYHWSSSSTQLARCSVRPGTAVDVGIILDILGSTRTPFAVKGGGHASNPGFSSTTGVLIAMSRFREIAYNATSQNVIVGAGLVWDDVYAALEPHNANVVGGRESGVGVAGLTLGGGWSIPFYITPVVIRIYFLGYSWLSNQHGLTLDTVQAFELVKPDGVVVTVTQTSDPELFFGLKGGMNNFGIVTRFTLRTFPQGKVWGGLLTYTSAQVSAISAAIAAFSASSTDPKAGLTMAYNFLGELEIRVLLFYDGPTPPAGIFDKFLAIPFYSKDISTRNFLSLVKASPPFTSSALQRVLFNTVSLAQYTPAILKVIVNETIFWGSQPSLAASSPLISYGVEPFLPSLFAHGAPSAYPPSRSISLSPFNIYFRWIRESYDNDFYAAARESAAHIRACAIAEGQDIAGAAVYPGYALFGTPISDLYGANLPALQALKAKVDPDNVMGLAGGFKI